MTAIYEALKIEQAAEARRELQNGVAVKHQAAAEKLAELCSQLVMGHGVIVARVTMMHTQVLGYVSAGVTFVGPESGVTCYTQSFSAPSFEEIAEMAHNAVLDAARELDCASLVKLLTL